MDIKTYWNYTKSIPHNLELITKNAHIGMTENKNVNAYLAVSKIYYDFYNNGGTNLRDIDEQPVYLRELLQHIQDVNITIFKNISLSQTEDMYEMLVQSYHPNVYDNLEAFVDLVIELIHEKDLTFPSYHLYIKRTANTFSYTSKPKWQHLTFGEIGTRDKWITTLIHQHYIQIR